MSGKIPALETSRLNRRKADSIPSFSPGIICVIVSPIKLTFRGFQKNRHFQGTAKRSEIFMKHLYETLLFSFKDAAERSWERTQTVYVEAQSLIGGFLRSNLCNRGCPFLALVSAQGVVSKKGQTTSLPLKPTS